MAQNIFDLPPVVIDKKLSKSIREYCELNDLDTDKFANKLLKEAFLKEKYGSKPPFLEEKKSKEKISKSTPEPIKEEDTEKEVPKVIKELQYIPPTDNKDEDIVTKVTEPSLERNEKIVDVLTEIKPKRRKRKL